MELADSNFHWYFFWLPSGIFHTSLSIFYVRLKHTDQLAECLLASVGSQFITHAIYISEETCFQYGVANQLAADGLFGVNIPSFWTYYVLGKLESSQLEQLRG